MRILTVSYVFRQNYLSQSLFPQIRLKGKWLEKLGITIGSQVEVEIQEDAHQLVIRKCSVQPADTRIE